MDQDLFYKIDVALHIFLCPGRIFLSHGLDDSHMVRRILLQIAGDRDTDQPISVDPRA